MSALAPYEPWLTVLAMVAQMDPLLRQWTRTVYMEGFQDALFRAQETLEAEREYQRTRLASGYADTYTNDELNEMAVSVCDAVETGLNMLTFGTKLVNVDTPTANGRIYPREVMEAAVKAFQEDGLSKTFGYRGLDDARTLPEHEPTHRVVSCEVTDTALLAYIQLQDGPHRHKIAEGLRDGRYHFSPMFEGEIQDGVVQPGAVLRSVDLVDVSNSPVEPT